MRLSIQTAAYLAASLILPVAIAQDSSPGGPVNPGQPSNCNGWHTIVDGDNCENVAQQFGITLAQFLEWNPAVSSDCKTNFWLESAYCVRVGVSSVSSVSSSKATTASSSASRTASQTTITSAPKTSSSSYISSSSLVSTSSHNSTYSTAHPVTSWNITTTSTDSTWPPTKTLAGMTTICNAYHRVSAGDTCQRVLDKYGLASLSDFLSWNPAAKDDCDMLIADYYVCVGVQRQVGNTDLEWETAQPAFTEPPSPTTYTPTTLTTADSSFTPTPSQGPMPTNCRVFHQATADQNCNDLVTLYGTFTQEQFFAWNPVLDGNCQGLWLDTWYCVGAYDDNDLPLPPHQTAKPTSGNIPEGYPSDCARWYETTGGDTCDLIALMFGSFSTADFVKWNPSVFDDCSGIVENAWYCVGSPDTPTTRTSGAASPTTSVSSSRPTQSGIATGCSKFWLVSAADTCDSIVRQAGITADDFYSWNHAITVGSCEGLAADYYVCVGVDGQGETSTGIQITQTASSTRPATTSTAVKTTQTASSASSTRPATTTTAAPSPIQTPSPVRESMAADCVAFYLQHSGEYCGDIASAAGISLA